MPRPYDVIARDVARRMGAPRAQTPVFAGVSASRGRGSPGAGAAREAAMGAVVDACWDALHALGVSWIGFYTRVPGAPDHAALVLGPRRDKPACSPLGLHGACGQALTAARTLIVRDVADLGADYIACDPRDRSEIVIPLLDSPAGPAWGVLDVDSFDLAAFDDADARGLKEVLHAAGFITD